MPVDVDVDGKRQVVPMTSGHGSLELPAWSSRVTLDPDSKILRQSDEIDRYRSDQSSKKPYGPS